MGLTTQQEQPSIPGLSSKVVALAAPTPASDTPGNPFPLHAFPEKLQAIIKAANEYHSFPIDFFATDILAAISIAVGNTHTVATGGYVQPGIIYAMNIGNSGANKTSPAKYALHPIFERNAMHCREYNNRHAAYLQDLAKFKHSKDAGAAPPTEPKEKILLLSDFTFEGLISKHDSNPRGVGVFVDELMSMINNFSRYTTSDAQQKLLSGWGGYIGPIVRKNAPTVNIRHWYCPIVGSTQPENIPLFLSGGRDNDGFAHRFLIAFPDGLTRPPRSRMMPPAWIEADYTTFINALLDLPEYCDAYGDIRPTAIQLSSEADAVYDSFYNTNRMEWECAVGAEQAYLSKQDAHALRLSLLLQLAMYACGEDDKAEISGAAMRGAVALSEYYKNGTFKMLRYAANENPIEFATSREQAIYEALPEADFMVAEVIALLKPYYPKDAQANTIRTAARRICQTPLYVKVDNNGRYRKAAPGESTKQPVRRTK